MFAHKSINIDDYNDSVFIRNKVQSEDRTDDIERMKIFVDGFLSK